MLKRINFGSWRQLEPYWTDGLIERTSLIRRSFSNPILVYPDFLPALCCRNFQNTSVHTISSIEVLGLSSGKHDLILFAPFLQWTQDVPGMLKQAYQALANEGFFVACFFGQDTLIEFKSICAEFDLKYMQGMQQRFLPTIHAKDAGMLIQRAGFSSPTSDVEHLCFSLESVQELISKLRGSGLTNGKTNQHIQHLSTRSLPKHFSQEIQSSYIKQHPHSVSGINVSVDLIFMCGWKQNELNASRTLSNNQPIVL